MGAPAAMLCLAGLSTARDGPVVSGAATGAMFLAPLHERWEDGGPALPAAAALSSHVAQAPIDRNVEDVKPIESERSSHASFLDGLSAPESLSRVLGRQREDSVATHASDILEDFDREVVVLFDDCRSELRDAMEKVWRLRMASLHSPEDAPVERRATPPADDGSHSWHVQRFLLSEVSRAAGDWSGVVDRRAEWREQRRRRHKVFIAAPVIVVPKPTSTKAATSSKQSLSASSVTSSSTRSRHSKKEGISKAAAFDNLPLVPLHDSVVPVWTLERRME